MFGFKRKNKRKIENIEEILAVKTDTWEEANSERLDNIERVIKKLADKMGYRVDYYSRDVEPKELPKK